MAKKKYEITETDPAYTRHYAVQDMKTGEMLCCVQCGQTLKYDYEDDALDRLEFQEMRDAQKSKGGKKNG